MALSGGAVFGGSVRGDGHDLGFGPGLLVSVRVAWRWLEQDGPVPFVVTSLTACHLILTREKSRPAGNRIAARRFDPVTGRGVARVASR